MAKLPILSGREIIKILLKAGYIEVRHAAVIFVLFVKIDSLLRCQIIKALTAHC